MSARDGIGKDAMYHDLRRKGLGENCAWDVASMPPPDRLALARALVADMPGVVCAVVPAAWLVPAEKNTPYNKGRRRGWNDFRTELISAGSATHQPKEPTDAG